MSNVKKYITHDISLAAYLLMKGLVLESAKKSTSRYDFTFLDPNSEGQQFILEFSKTPFAQYDSYLRTLRNLIQK